MIKITQVSRTGGEVKLMIEFTATSGTETLEMDANQIVDRLKEFRVLVGRSPTLQEAREVVVALINEIRVDKEPIVNIIPWETFIGVDLEA